MAANRTAPQPQYPKDSHLPTQCSRYDVHLRDELNHRQHIENYILGLTHELKTPLTAQNAALELLQDSELSPEQQQLVSRIQRNTHKQQQLITQLLELARLENCDNTRKHTTHWFSIIKQTSRSMIAIPLAPPNSYTSTSPKRPHTNCSATPFTAPSHRQSAA